MNLSLIHEFGIIEKMKDIKITKAKITDKDQLALTFQHFKDEKMMTNRAECYLSHNNVFIAKDRDQIIGKMLWHVKEDPNEGVAEFEELYVYEEYRRIGIGSKLIEISLQAVKEYFKKRGIDSRRIFLFVGEKNEIARKLYEKFGFECIANLGNLFTENEKDLFYVLDLTKSNRV